MKENHIYQGNCLDVIKTFDDESIDCVITSPPYWQLRDYGWDGQWGLEPTYQMYLENLWSLMDEIKRVLKKTGTVWFNLGDTYGTQSGQSRGKSYDSDKTYLKNVEDGSELIKGKVPHKCLLLIPHRFAIGCIERGWIVRNDIIWAKRNGMPESVTDRFSKKHEYIFLMTKSTKYYFDLDGIRDKQKEISLKRYEYDFTGTEGGTQSNMQGNKRNILTNIKGNMTKKGLTRTTAGLSMKTAEQKLNPLGKNPGSVSDFWDITTKSSKSSHYATYNNELIEKPIVAGCPKGGIILDPFCGTATTGVRAIQLGRKFIGIEGSKEYVKIGNNLLDVERLQTKLF